PASPYESVFETAHKIASVRAQEQQRPAAVVKGKEPEVVVDYDDDEEDDEDFVPSDETKDDDEEEELERQLEPIDESEEVIEPSKPPAAPYEAASSSQEQSAEDESDGILEESASAGESEEEIVEPDVVEEVSESEVAASEEEQAELSSEDEVQVSIEESESTESDQATEELASIASAESISLGGESEADESTQPLPESPAEPLEPVDDAEPESPVEPLEVTGDAQLAAPVQPNTVQQTPTSRKWWPFSGSSFLNSLLNTEKRQSKRSLQESESTASEPPMVSPTFGQRRALSKHSSGRLFVPASFIDVTKEASADNGKRARVTERSVLKRNTLLDNRRRTAVLPTRSTPVSSAAVSTDTISTSPKRSSRKQSTPLITAASLGLEGRRNAARGYSGQQRQYRRRTCLYYGSGYGSSSTPYVFDTMRSALADTDKRKSFAHTSADQEVAADTTIENSGGVRSSTTAQRILDIIGDAPPTRSQTGLDSQSAANPYELSSPYSVRMQLKTTQRRRVLVPLSTRLSQPTGSKSSSEQRDSKAILESIQSAAPPEIQAKLGSAHSLAAKEPSSDLPKVPQLTAKNISSKSAVDMTPPPPTQAQISTPATSAIIMKPTVATSTPTKSSVLSPKQFSFTLPLPSTPDSGHHKAVKLRVANLPIAELPAFVFTLSEQQPASAASKPIPATTAATEWTCELCDLKSPDTASKCIVCDADRPVSKPATIKPAPAPANSKEWECAVCELKSPATADKCIVCDSPRPAGSSTASAPKAAPVAPSAQEWECKVCELKNPPSAKDCTVCDAPKPAGSKAPPNPASSNPASVSKPAPIASSAQEWECKVCELKNPPSAKDCTVCDAPKPEKLVTGLQSAATSAKAPNASGSEWTCELCDLKSPESANKCIVCDAPKPGPKPTTAAPQNKSAPSFEFGLDVTKKPAVPASWTSSKFSMPSHQGQWECAVCELKNEDSAVKCTVCDAARPAAALPALATATKQTVNTSLPVFEFDLDVSRKPLPPKQHI
ncbi:hypothetical protein IWW36_004547, partial [Coemansia brasiliensis]